MNSSVNSTAADNAVPLTLAASFGLTAKSSVDHPLLPLVSNSAASSAASSGNSSCAASPAGKVAAGGGALPREQTGSAKKDADGKRGRFHIRALHPALHPDAARDARRVPLDSRQGSMVTRSSRFTVSDVPSPGSGSRRPPAADTSAADPTNANIAAAAAAAATAVSVASSAAAPPHPVPPPPSRAPSHASLSSDEPHEPGSSVCSHSPNPSIGAHPSHYSQTASSHEMLGFNASTSMGVEAASEFYSRGSEGGTSPQGTPTTPRAAHESNHPMQPMTADQPGLHPLDILSLLGNAIWENLPDRGAEVGGEGSAGLLLSLLDASREQLFKENEALDKHNTRLRQCLHEDEASASERGVEPGVSARDARGGEVGESTSMAACSSCDGAYSGHPAL